MACSPVYSRRVAETVLARSLLASDRKSRRVNPSHAPSLKFGENKGLNALAKLLKVMDIPRSELDWVLQPFGINK